MNTTHYDSLKYHPKGDVVTALLTHFPAPLAALFLMARRDHAAPKRFARNMETSIIKTVQLRLLGSIMKKIIAFVFMFVCSLAFAGVLEDLDEAIVRGDSSEAIRLMNRGVDVNSVNKQGNTLLMQAVRRDMPEFFDFLLNHRARLNVRNKNGESALAIAAYEGRVAFAKRLVDSGAEVNTFGWPPLIYASYNGHLEIAEYLLKRGAEIDAKAANGATALFFAARFGHEKVVDLLLTNEADPTITSDHDETAVDWALKAENTDIADKLRAAGGRSGRSLTIQLSH